MKPESAQQVDREIYIGGDGGAKKPGIQSPGSSMISIGDVTIREHRIGAAGDGHPQGSTSRIRGGRNSSLPTIKGVNRNSLGLLIDEPEKLLSSLTPLSRRGLGGLRGRNNSVQIHGATQDVTKMSGMISPGYNSIVSSARKEI